MVVFRAWPKIESVRSPLWKKTGRPAGSLQRLCPNIRLRAWTRMHRKRLTIDAWEEFRTSDLDLSQTGVCPGDLVV